MPGGGLSDGILERIREDGRSLRIASLGKQIGKSWSVVLLKDADIETVVLDGHMSILEGSIGALPRRLMVDGADEVRARHILIEAGVVSEPS